MYFTSILVDAFSLLSFSYLRPLVHWIKHLNLLFQGDSLHNYQSFSHTIDSPILLDHKSQNISKMYYLPSWNLPWMTPTFAYIYRKIYQKNFLYLPSFLLYFLIHYNQTVTLFFDWYHSCSSPLTSILLNPMASSFFSPHSTSWQQLTLWTIFSVLKQFLHLASMMPLPVVFLVYLTYQPS